MCLAVLFVVIGVLLFATEPKRVNVQLIICALIFMMTMGRILGKQVWYLLLANKENKRNRLQLVELRTGLAYRLHRIRSDNASSANQAEVDRFERSIAMLTDLIDCLETQYLTRPITIFFKVPALPATARPLASIMSVAVPIFGTQLLRVLKAHYAPSLKNDDDDHGD